MAIPNDRYLYRMKHGVGLAVDLRLNDVPFYRRVSEYSESPAGTASHLLVEGENVLSLWMGEIEKVPWLVRSFEFLILRDGSEEPIFRLTWPEFAEEQPEGERDLPIKHEARFVFAEPTPKALWVEAPVENVPPEGTESLHDALRELHAAYASGDVDAFLKVMEHKTAEMTKFYGPIPDLAPAAAKEYYGEKLAQPWKLEPYDPKKVVFERCANGRAAYARNLEGGPALFAQHEHDPGETWQANPLFARVDGRWRVIW